MGKAAPAPQYYQTCLLNYYGLAPDTYNDADAYRLSSLSSLSQTSTKIGPDADHERGDLRPCGPYACPDMTAVRDIWRSSVRGLSRCMSSHRHHHHNHHHHNTIKTHIIHAELKSTQKPELSNPLMHVPNRSSHPMHMPTQLPSLNELLSMPLYTQPQCEELCT